jgi:glycosyltransferase involved in cell wall biosynthesis
MMGDLGETPMPKISVIVPVYRTRPYLERCLRSIMAQTLRDIEIVCVDDASPDGSAELVARLAAEDPRIRLIRHDRNRGLGPARNSGIEVARGEFIAGVDSDDHIAPDMMERLWQGGDGGVADIVACGVAMVKEDGSPNDDADGPGFELRPARHVAADGQSFATDGRTDIFSLLAPAFYLKIWRRSLFMDTGIRFPDTTYAEDLGTTPRLVAVAREIRTIPGRPYFYVRRPGSHTRSFGPRHLFDHFRVYDVLEGFLHDRGLAGRHREGFVAMIDRSLAYHARCVLLSEGSDADKARHLRRAVMLKHAWLEDNTRLRGLDPARLAELIARV